MKSIIVIIVGIAALSFLINGAANWLESQPSPPDQKFSVVDAYKGCDVVRYNPDGSARYSYMLYCGEQK